MPKRNRHPNQAHKYLRVELKTSKGYKWRCVLPDCFHWIGDEFIVGATCQCWRCGKDFVIEKATKLMKPHCRNCTRHKSQSEVEVALPPIEESPI